MFLNSKEERKLNLDHTGLLKARVSLIYISSQAGMSIFIFSPNPNQKISIKHFTDIEVIRLEI